MYSHILIATDGSELAGRGLDQGLALGKALGARVTVLTVSEPWTPIGVDATGFGVTEYGLIEEYEKEVDRIGKAILAQAAIAAAAAGVEANMVYVALTHPADAIVDYMDAHDVDLVVMASHGRRGIRRVFLGSQTAEVATRSDVPVLVVR
jgi:nucleotide-binding universal stress UspA family protein